jgi:hypothetical protein
MSSKKKFEISDELRQAWLETIRAATHPEDFKKITDIDACIPQPTEPEPKPEVKKDEVKVKDEAKVHVEDKVEIKDSK